MTKNTLFCKVASLAKNIAISFKDAFAGNLFAGSVNTSGSHWCVVDRLFYN